MGDFVAIKGIQIHKVHTGWIVKRDSADQSLHSHFENRQACEKLVHLLNLGILPKNEYYRIAARRILSDEEYDSLRMKCKDSYYNRTPQQFGRRV